MGAGSVSPNLHNNTDTRQRTSENCALINDSEFGRIRRVKPVWLTSAWLILIMGEKVKRTPKCGSVD